MSDPLAPQPNPAGDYEESLDRFRRISSAEGPEIDSVCRSALLHHGRPTEHVFVFFHGYTNCPAQVSGLASGAHDMGANVFSPLAPGHGRADHDLSGLTLLSKEGLARFVDEAIDLAAGLGRRVTIMGFSFGGVCASWAAASRDDVAEALILSPSFLPFGYPSWAGRFIAPLAQVLPERYLWWDPVRKQDAGSAPYAYSRLSRRGIGAAFALGQDVWHHPARRTIRLERAVLALNATDVAVNPYAASLAFRRSLMPVADSAEVYRFPARLRYRHDLIDPQGMIGHVAPEVWPVLLGLTTLGRAREDTK